MKAVDTDAYPRELLADEEPKYLRRQKPLEIKRRKFGRKAWKTYLRVTFWTASGLAGACAIYAAANYLYSAPGMLLIHPSQIEISQTQYVRRARILDLFVPDRGRSVLRIPLDERRRQIEALPWVEHAAVRRALPNRIQIEITERAPIAFLREGSQMALVDAHGVILPQPAQANFDFPVVTGIAPDMSPDDREKRTQLFSAFSRDIEIAHPGAMAQVNEVDLTVADDLRASIAGLPGVAGSSAAPPAASDDDSLPAVAGASAAPAATVAPVLVHFGNDNFADKYRTLVENFPQWLAKAGSIASIDLRFSREAVVNADPAVAGSASAARLPAVAGQNVQRQPSRAAIGGRAQ